MNARHRSLALHGLWAALTLGANRFDRRLQRSGMPEGVSVLATIVAWYTLLGIVERRRPHDEDWQATGDDLKADLPFFGMATVAGQVGQQLTASSVGRFGRSPGAVARLGVPGGVVLSLLTSELVHYSLHRLSHEWGPAWTVHSVHHSPERLHIYNATRFQPAETFVETAIEAAALWAVGLSPSQHLTHATARATYGQLQHANIELDSGALDFVFATPDLHRWHHSEVYAEGDNNYGAVLSVWDGVFGTVFRPNRKLDSRLGVGRMPHFPQGLLGLLAAPLRWSKIKQENAETWFDAAGDSR